MPRRGDRLWLCAAYCIHDNRMLAERAFYCFATMSGYPITSSLPPIFSYKRWEMETTVRFSPARLSAYKTSCSVPTSRFAVISSSSRIDGFAATARAMDKSCHCPCENSASVQGVSYPCSIPAITSCSPASFAASTASSLEIIGSESVICSRTVPGTRLKLCSTQPNRRRLILSGSR